jgi:hypothetical protein
MADKESKQKEALKKIIDQVIYLQQYGITALKYYSLPSQEYEKILEKCLAVLNEDSIPSKKILMETMESFEETRNMMIYDYSEALYHIESIKVDQDYFENDSINLAKMKMYEKISNRLEKMKRGFCD